MSRSNLNTPQNRGDWREWQLYRAITPKTLLFAFLAFVLLSWSANNTEMDKAALETGKAVLSVFGIGESNVLQGVSKFGAQAFPLQISTRTELSRVQRA